MTSSPWISTSNHFQGSIRQVMQEISNKILDFLLWKWWVWPIWSAWCRL